MKQLTQKQQDIIDFIDGYRKRYGSSPLPCEMARELKIPGKYIYRYLQFIERKGYIELAKPRHRIVIKRLEKKESRKKKEIIRVPLANGKYAGEWNGYEVRVTHNGIEKCFVESIGIIGMYVPCTVMVRGGVMSVSI